MSKVKKRIIAVFTGNRAEYGLQQPILKAIDDHPMLDYRLIVSGAHLDENFGNTLDEIRRDGFEIHAEIKIEMDAGDISSTANAIGSGIVSIGRVLKEALPDFMVVYADRFEGFAAVIAASQMNIPTAHIEGGDITKGGALDDSVRHAMTKLSHLHFTTNEDATERILAMGEEEWRVHTVGFPTIDLISKNNYATQMEVINDLQLDLKKPILLFTQHSVTTEFYNAVSQLEPSIRALRYLADKKEAQIIVTYPNNDAGGKDIVLELQKLSRMCVNGFQVHRSLGRYLYYGVLALALNKEIKVACVGNSSSGIKETPFFGCPTVNVGSRQDGRLTGQNVIHTNYDYNEVIEALEKCLFDDGYREVCRNTNNPYYSTGVGHKVADILSKTPLGTKLLRKKMTI